MAKALFGAGCFWGVEDAFMQVPGVTATAVGYAGGLTDNPTYKQVCSDSTGHAEVTLVEYDPAQVSYEKLLDVFFQIHNPTQVNRQGPDFGSQYRTVVFTYDDEQAAQARAAIAEEQGRHSKPIATKVEPAPEFWPAEEYHQKYFQKNGVAGCHVQL